MARVSTLESVVPAFSIPPTYREGSGTPVEKGGEREAP